MKTTFNLLIGLFISFSVFAQIANDNTLSVQIDGKEYKTAPRRINIGAMWYITANAVKPDKSLRFWFITFEGKQIPGPGLYKIVDEDYPVKRKTQEELLENGKYKGLAFARYAEETRTPRMEFHLGKSRRDNGGEVEITSSTDKALEGKFSAVLDGTYWKERTSSTVLGGIGRLKSKMEDKIITSATGYDSDIDPEKWDYKKQDKTDEIVLKEGAFKLILAKEEK
ncbi:MAG: hypothetical protein R2822_10600 [Spirosomataceae bacterium]